MNKQNLIEELEAHKKLRQEYLAYYRKWGRQFRLDLANKQKEIIDKIKKEIMK